MNVVPGKAYAVTEGLDREVMDQVAAEVEKRSVFILIWSPRILQPVSVR